MLKRTCEHEQQVLRAATQAAQRPRHRGQLAGLHV